MVNKNELAYLAKIFENPTVMAETKVSIEYFTDVFAQVLFGEIGKSFCRVGDFKAYLHLKDLIEDKERLDKLSAFGYPFIPTDIESVINYVKTFDIELKVSVIEDSIKSDYIKRKIRILSQKLGEQVVDSNISSKEMLRKASTALDNLLYDQEDDVERVSADDIVAMEIAYQNSPERTMLKKSGIAIIDKVAGGITSPSTNYILATSKSGKSLGLYNALLERLKNGQTCIFATVEINTQECYQKILAAYARIDFLKIQRKDLTLDERKLYLEKVKDFGSMYKDKLFIYYNRSGCSPKDIEIYCNKLSRSGIKIDDIFVDYLAIMQSSDPTKKSTVDIMLSLPKEIRVLSQKTNTSVFTAQQLATAAELKEIKDITIDDIYYSKTIAHEATNIVVFKRDDQKKIKTKQLPSRTVWSNEIYEYTDSNLDQCYLGEIGIAQEINW